MIRTSQSQWTYGQAKVTRIVRTPTNLPNREVITGTKTVVTQGYSSKRYRGSYGVEGYTAMLLAKHDEVVSNVVDSAPEFMRIEGLVDGKPAACIPDRCRVLASGRVEIIEAKHYWKAFSRDQALKQSALIQAVCDERGWDYVRIVPAKIGSEQFRRNIHCVQLCRHVSVTHSQLFAAIEITRHGPIPLGWLCLSLEKAIGRHGNDALPIGRAVAYALMVRRVISIDLAGELNDATLVTRAPTFSTGLPTFRSSAFA